MIRINFSQVWVFLYHLTLVIGVLTGFRYLQVIVKYLRQISNSIQRIVWQSDTVWALTAIQYGIPISASTAAGTEEGERIKNKIIADAKIRYKKENGEAKGAH